MFAFFVYDQRDIKINLTGQQNARKSMRIQYEMRLIWVCLKSRGEVKPDPAESSSVAGLYPRLISSFGI